MQQSISSYYGPRVDSVEGLFRGWYDVLRTYDGKGIQYDRSGNPVSYDGKTFSWNGKQLIKVTAADGSYTEFSYDANGIRTQKRQYTSGGTLEYDVDYVWQDGLLTHQSMTYYLRITIKNETRVVKIPFSAKFVYDESNTPVGCLVNDEAAVGFVRNLQGDIIATVTHEGDVLAEYSYDPWGKVTVTCDGEEFEGMEAALMALYCPFAYRGYNYDYTTGLYYLQSRYYNPEWGRFLNVDDTNILLSTQGENLGVNLFAYCNNNPVNQVDYSGRFSVELSLPELDIWFQGLIATFIIIDKKNYSHLLAQEFCGFMYFDICGVLYMKAIFKNDNTVQKYTVFHWAAGSTSAWTKYARRYEKPILTKRGQSFDFQLQLDAAQNVHNSLFPLYLEGLEGTVYEHAFSAATHIIWELDYRRKREETLLPSDYIYQYEILAKSKPGYLGVIYKEFDCSYLGALRQLSSSKIPDYADIDDII